MLTDSILFARSNLIHPVIIHPEQFVSELGKTIPSLPPSLSYVLPLTIGNANDLMKVTFIRCFTKDNRIIYVISNPLVNGIEYQVYDLIPLPVKQRLSNNYIFILPSVRYLALDATKNYYFPMKSFENCQNFKQSLILCAGDEPIFSSYVRPICETELLFPLTEIPKTCDQRITSNFKEIWRKLNNKNEWIYVLPKETGITLNCKTPTEGYTITHFSLVNTGIISLNSDCKLYTSSTTLMTVTTHYTSNFKSIIPNISIDDEICCEKFKRINMSELGISLSKPLSLDIESLHVASHKLDQIEKLTDAVKETTIIEDIYNNSYFAYVVCTIFKIIVLFLLYKLYKIFKNRYCNSNKDKCNQITNCLTLNICKRNVHNEVDIELEGTEDSPSTSTERTSLRRSLRIAKLKEKI
ncbi:hypothetical protein AMK59_2104 [Oryctes borbonicus]|uniref:Envelope fusion protein n=1 Tax=Oryctes borbonicus TaxID=1629725 RepID=A0A0T6BHL9_9SCAR|nr:hypothetical protein AMK59_2104 [Oryctes borbonicus]